MESNFLKEQLLLRYADCSYSQTSFSKEAINTGSANSNFIQSLHKVFENESCFSEAEFNCFSIEIILDYIQRTHQFYLTKKLLEIEQSIHLLLRNYSDTHPLLVFLHRFYYNYKMDLSHHILEEENQLLPYIHFLQQTDKNGIQLPTLFFRTQNYSLKKFMAEHQETEMDVQTVRDAILQYQPAPTNESPYRILLSQLQLLEKDLMIHGLIEDRILIPKALALEKKMMQELKRKSCLN